jgi:hypothetical protein
VRIKAGTDGGTCGLVILLDALADHEPVDGASSIRIIGVRLVERNDDHRVTGVWVEVSSIEERL